jgi:hypothetical protein
MAAAMSGDINWFLTALFNPLLLFFILGFFFFGKLVGRMVSRPNVWKLLILCYFGIFLIEPLRNLGWVFGGFFLLGFFSGTIRNLPGIIAWADGLGDLVFALKHRSAYEELKRQEERFEEELRRAREQAARANTGQSRQQQEWASEARQAREGKQRTGENEKDRGGGRSQGGSSSSSERVGGEKAQPKQASFEDRIQREHLETLGLDPAKTHSLHEIKKAYRKRVKETHPDVGGDPIQLRKVRSAWQWLRRDG